MFPSFVRIESLQETLGNDLLQFMPELLVSTGIVALLLARLVPILDRAHLGSLALTVLAVALFTAGYQFATVTRTSSPFFGSMLISDPFAALGRCLILSAALLTVLMTQLSGIPDRADSSDFHTLLLGGTLGMMLMVSANHLLMLFIAIEMASLPGYALAGFLKGRRRGSEAALKYVVYGAGASGIMLYGISLLAGTFGTGYLPDIAFAIARRGLDLPVLAGSALILVGLGFKLAAVPFHFWCPDVFEGAAAEVAGFLSVASKAAAVALTARLLLTLQAAHQENPWAVKETLGLAVGVMAAVTATFGNLAAFGQTNINRLLAYSTIAHAGYMLLAVAVITPAAAAAVLYYLAAYILMNLGAFAVAAFVRNSTGSETLEGFRGLARRQPVLAVTMTIFLLSLLGLPPLAGFAGKFQVFVAVYDAAREAVAAAHANLGTALYVLLAIGLVNTAVSAYYYLRVARVMLLEEPDGTAAPQSTSPGVAFYLTVMAIALFVLGIAWNPLVALVERAGATFGR
jgi:NADH-quinone oxidoreductase subunit N